MNQPWSMPDRKVLASGVAGILAWALMIVAGRYGYPIDVGLQPVIVTLVGTVMGYVVPPSLHDIVKRLDDQIVNIAIADPNIPVTGVVRK